MNNTAERDLAIEYRLNNGVKAIYSLRGEEVK